MSLTKTPTDFIIRVGIVLGAGVALVAACVSHDRPRPTCGELEDGGVAFSHPLPDGAPYDASPSTDAQPPSTYGIEPDPGPYCLDCTQGSELEVMTMADFEDGFAPGWFNYGEPGIPIQPGQVGQVDAGNVVTADGGLAPITINVPEPYWGLQATDLRAVPGGARCGSNYGLHMTGGRFVSWGGGYATLYATIRGARNVNDQCVSVPDERLRSRIQIPGVESPEPVPPKVLGDSCGFWMTPVEVTQPARLGLDASGFEGLAFWARRGPGGQASLRISILDDNTSDGLALSVEREAYFAREMDPNASVEAPRCERIRECCRGCRDVTFQPFDAGSSDNGGLMDGMYQVGDFVTEKRCHLEGEPLPQYLLPGSCKPEPIDPSSGLLPAQIFVGPVGADACPRDAGVASDAGIVMGTEANMQTTYDNWRRDYKLCCPDTIEKDRGNGDPKFGGKQCAPYIFRNDPTSSTSGYYCYDPGDVLPERNENRCEDGFEANVTVDTEWRLFTIPWSELRRFTPNRPPIDPRGIWKVAFYFGAGNLDTYVDDIGFYRKRH